MFEEYVPRGAILLWSIILNCARFENQRWTRARQAGMRGSSEGFGLFVDLTGFIGLLASITVLALSLFDFGWKQTLGLFVLTMIAGWVWGAVGAYVGRAITTLGLWIAGTVLVYVAAVPLFLQFSWFGLR